MPRRIAGSAPLAGGAPPSSWRAARSPRPPPRPLPPPFLAALLAAGAAAAAAVSVNTYTLVAEYPHDSGAFTQGARGLWVPAGVGDLMGSCLTSRMQRLLHPAAYDPGPPQRTGKM
eukprot:356668-Chlamydomonas_euryale.AAC.2